MSSESLKSLQTKIAAFDEARGWRKEEVPKDLAISVVLEAAELLEYFQWIKEGDMATQIEKKREKIGDEMADVLI